MDLFPDREMPRFSLGAFINEIAVRAVVPEIFSCQHEW